MGIPQKPEPEQLDEYELGIVVRGRFANYEEADAAAAKLAEYAEMECGFSHSEFGAREGTTEAAGDGT